MLFNLLLGSIIILLCFFFFFLVSFNSFFIIPAVKENTNLRLALITPAGIPITFVKEIILIRPLVADKTINVLSVQSRAAVYLLNFLITASLSLVSNSKYCFILLISSSLNFYLI